MSKEKQIEIPKDEMGMSGYSKLAWKLWHEVKLPMTQCVVIDRVVREAGYRKQNEGEWIEQIKVARQSNKPPLLYYQCSLCGVYLAKRANFCPNCGAKMKGGE